LKAWSLEKGEFLKEGMKKNEVRYYQPGSRNLRYRGIMKCQIPL
jgi:hypothetical protein